METVKQSCWGFLRTGNAKDGKMEALPCLGKDAHIYCSNGRREPKCHLTHQKPPFYQKSQRTPSMETWCCWMLPVCLTHSWANSWGRSCSSSTSPPQTPPIHCLQLLARSHIPRAATDQQPLLQSSRQLESSPCTHSLPKALLWLHMTAYAERVHKGQGDAG